MGYNIGDFIDVRDSYPPHEKQLVKDFNFFYCKRISITKKTPLTYPQKKSIWQIIISFLWKEPEEIKRLEPDLNPDFVSPKTRPVVEEPPKLKWKFPSDARHSVRVLCDELGLTVAEKNLICQVIQCESGFRTDAKNENKDKNGKILSTDWGICQMNDYWYIGKNRPIATIREAIENPEKCVRIMIKRYKEGGLRDWVCYLKGMYKNYKP